MPRGQKQIHLFDRKLDTASLLEWELGGSVCEHILAENSKSYGIRKCRIKNTMAQAFFRTTDGVLDKFDASIIGLFCTLKEDRAEENMYKIVGIVRPANKYLLEQVYPLDREGKMWHAQPSLIDDTWDWSELAEESEGWNE